MSDRKKEALDAFVALQHIISSTERISELVHPLLASEAIKEQIDKEIEKIAQRCIEISQVLEAVQSS